MAVLVLPISWASERALKGVTVLDVYPVHDHSCSRLLRLLHVEVTVIVAEVLLLLRKHEWENSLLELIWPSKVVTTVHE